MTTFNRIWLRISMMIVLPIAVSAQVTSLDQVPGEVDLRYNTTFGAYYEDIDGDGTHDVGEPYLSNNIQTAGGYADRLRICHPEDFDSLSSTTSGIQECINELYKYGGGKVELTSRPNYHITSSNPITIDWTHPNCVASGAGACEITIEGHGIGASAIQCMTANGCTAPSVIKVLGSHTTIRDLHVICNTGSACTGIQIGDAANYVGYTLIERVQLDGNSAQSPGSRTGIGLHVLHGLTNRFEGIEARWFSDCVNFSSAQSTHQATTNVLSGGHLVSCDTGIDTTVGTYGPGRGDAEQLWISNMTIEGIYLYGLHLRAGFGASNISQANSARVMNSWFEVMDTGIFVEGGNTIYDPHLLSVGNNFTAMVDVAGDADADSDGIVVGANSDSDIISDSDWLNVDSCITYRGTGAVHYRNDFQNAPLSCAPNMVSGRLADYDKDIPSSAVSSSDVSSTTATYAAVPGLTMKVAANKRYIVQCLLTTSAQAVGTGVRVNATGPAAVSQVTWSRETCNGKPINQYNAFGPDPSFNASKGTIRCLDEIEMNLQNGANAGTLGFEVASGVNGSYARIHQGSWCEYRPY